VDEAAARHDPGGRWWRLAPLATLLVAVLAHALLALRWIRLDMAVGEPVMCEVIGPVNRLIAMRSALPVGEVLFHEEFVGGLSWLGLVGRGLFGPSTDSLLFTLLALLVASQLLSFDIGRMLGGPWAGVLAAVLLPLVPDVALVSRRWAPHLPQMFVLLAALDCLLRSRSLVKLLPALGFSVLAVAGAILSTFATHDMLFLLAAGSMAAGAVLRGLVLGGPRWRVALGAVVVGALVCFTSWHLLHRIAVFDYYTDEAMGEAYSAVPASHPWALTAYLRHLGKAGLGPLLVGVGLAALVPYLWRGRGRAELLSWLLVPLVVLSLLAKKNWYYPSVVLPSVPLLLALGLHALPWRRLSAPLALLLVAATGYGWWRVSFHEHGSPVYYRSAAEDPAFQTSAPPSLAPLGFFRHERQTRLLRTNLPGSSCPQGRVVGQFPDAPLEDLVLSLKDLDPCLAFEPWTETQPFDWLLVSEHRCAASQSPRFARSCLREGSCELMDQDLDGWPCLWLLRMIRE